MFGKISKIFEISTVLFTLYSASSCSLFLENVPSTLINLAATASSSASALSDRLQPYSNIADLTRRNEKTEQIRSKYAVKENVDDSANTVGLNTNEVTPNIIQKKIGKILTKLKLISDISNIFFPNNEIVNNETNMVFNNTSEFTNNNENMELTTITSSKDEEDVEEISQQTFQKNIYPKSAEEPPIRFTLDIKGADEDRENYPAQDDTSPEDQKNLFGQVGIFLAEVLGSIVALAYGAAIQFNHFIEGTKEPSNA